ncbi:MAG: type 1 glutamine amidotransferase domain-containing protein [Actinomycetota bacterium]|nr:type 1 glutamine amidotransferase domain-containing protein [Actinomycetota bacterium]
MKILLILTSHDQLGDTGEKTGYWYEEMAAPYYRFTDAGAEVVVASPAGGPPPVDPMSNWPEYTTDDTRRFDGDSAARSVLARSVRLDSVTAEDFDGVFYAGGHGPMWDLAEDQVSIHLIEAFWRAGKPVASTCHGPAVLRHVTDSSSQPLVRGKRVTGFANTEEAAVKRTDAVPFLLEDELKRLGGDYSRAGDWQPHVVEDGKLITGQNPNSAGPVAEALLAQLS